MTSVKIFRSSGSPTKVEVHGHSGYANAGEDIVCAAITAALRLIEATFNDVLFLKLPVKTDNKTASVTIDFTSVPLGSENWYTIDVLIKGFALLVDQLSTEFPENIQLLEVQHNA